MITRSNRVLIRCMSRTLWYLGVSAKIAEGDAERGLGEEAARTGGGGDLPVEHDLLVGEAELLLEGLDQVGEAGDLGGREGATLAISDEADADGGAIEGIGVGSDDMGSGLLIEPAEADMDLAVGRAASVGDDEVVAEADESLVPVLAVDAVRRAADGA